MPLDFSSVDRTIQFKRQQIAKLQAIRTDVQDLDWHGIVDCYSDSIVIFTDNWDDHRHNVRVALEHYGEPIAQTSITHTPYSTTFRHLAGRERWSINGRFDSPIDLVYCFDPANPPERLTQHGCGFVEESSLRWACNTQSH